MRITEKMMKNQLGNSRMDTVLKMLLIAFISLLAFSSGVYFGKQLSDSDYQLKTLESDFSQHDKVVKGEGKDASPEEAINEEEVSALSEKLVNSEKGEAQAAGHPDEARKVASTEGENEEKREAQASANGEKEMPHVVPTNAPSATKHAEAKAPEKKSEKAAVAQAKPDLSAATKAAMRVANNAAPEEPAKKVVESRQPTSLPKTVGVSQDVEFTVQVASYPTAEAAKDHANELVKKGFPAFPVEASVNGKTWYRVSVGSFKTQREATVYRAQLLKQTTVASAIVQRIQR
jgi:cell division protein FtsN